MKERNVLQWKITSWWYIISIVVLWWATDDISTDMFFLSLLIFSVGKMINERLGEIKDVISKEGK